MPFRAGVRLYMSCEGFAFHHIISCLTLPAQYQGPSRISHTQGQSGLSRLCITFVVDNSSRFMIIEIKATASP